jgi:3-hydroxybutyryl-CoA dehydratase
MTQRQALHLEEGAALPAVIKTLTQETIDRYAAVSGDHNPLHTNEQYAAATPFKGTIAHGMLVLAYVSEMLTAAFGERWLSSGRLKVRFRAPARPGDTVTATGRVVRADEHNTVCEVECRQQDGELLISGEARVRA